MSAEFLEVRTPDGFTFWDFDKKVIRSALREVGKDVRKAARQRIRGQSKQRYQKAGMQYGFDLLRQRTCGSFIPHLLFLGTVARAQIQLNSNPKKGMAIRLHCLVRTSWRLLQRNTENVLRIEWRTRLLKESNHDDPNFRLHPSD